ncbi:MAG: type III toxin-antitoxin system ToxN/AbiQ family toxin [Lachnospiraceae bacterium]|nr:type III toxin-antitoxin system ToxN/AbiQ family toxin [Lachnospiraceae bacterium]
MATELQLFKIDADYIKYLHKIDYRVSVKYNNRPFVGIITMINDINYVLPLTSQTTQERKKEGKNKRSSIITTFIRDTNGTEIANILYNNMFPVKEGVYVPLNINAEINTYESNEIRYIRKNSENIVNKARKVYENRTTKYNAFLHKSCCDFKKLEKSYCLYKVKK